MRGAHGERYTSPQWQAFSEGVKRRDKFRCRLCNMPQSNPKSHLQVHHCTYDHWGHYDHLEMADCITLCCTCHFYFEQRKKGNVKIINYVGEKQDVMKQDPYEPPQPGEDLF